METETPEASSDNESVYASVGYCLYTLGMFEEAIAWTKSCIGPRLVMDTACRTLIEYEAQQLGGRLLGIDRATHRARYIVSAQDPNNANSISERLKTGINTIVPSQESYFDWISNAAPPLPIQDGYPFSYERDSSDFMRHKMNLLFALCGAADTCIANGRIAEAWRLLTEADVLEPNAGFIQERIEALP
ncbi:MAG TPA: hypothetical protein VMH87_06240 [Pseudomonadales bacterium]|nr:hypothetical protein [Pseudomonadales bacterium]